MNILAIGAHPDDIELGCFGVLTQHHKKKDKIFGLVLTNGELADDPKMRIQESKKSAKLINMKLIFASFPDGNLQENSKLVTFIDDVIKKFKINIMYTHSIYDKHQDHIATAKASISSSRNIDEAYSYETPSVLAPFNPQLYVDVTDVFRTKLTALRNHQSQKNKKFMRDSAIKGIAQFRGYQCGLHGKLCEGFEILRIIKK